MFHILIDKKSLFIYTKICALHFTIYLKKTSAVHTFPLKNQGLINYTMVNLEHVVVRVFLNVICKMIQLCIVLYCMYKHVFIMNKMRTLYMEYLQPTITNHSALLS